MTMIDIVLPLVDLFKTCSWHLFVETHYYIITSIAKILSIDALKKIKHRRNQMRSLSVNEKINKRRTNIIYNAG